MVVMTSEPVTPALACNPPTCAALWGEREKERGREGESKGGGSAAAWAARRCAPPLCSRTLFSQLPHRLALALLRDVFCLLLGWKERAKEGHNARACVCLLQCDCCPLGK